MVLYNSVYLHSCVLLCTLYRRIITMCICMYRNWVIKVVSYTRKVMLLNAVNNTVLNMWVLTTGWKGQHFPDEYIICLHGVFLNVTHDFHNMLYVCMYVCVRVCVCLCVCVYVCMCVCVDVWMCGCVDVWMYGCMYVRVPLLDQK